MTIINARNLAVIEKIAEFLKIPIKDIDFRLKNLEKLRLL